MMENTMKVWLSVTMAACMLAAGCGADSSSGAVEADVVVGGSDTITEFDSGSAIQDADAAELDVASGPDGQNGATDAGASAGDTEDASMLDSVNGDSDGLPGSDGGPIEPPSGALCPSVHFMDLSLVEGPGPGYGAPQVNVSCDEDTVTVNSNGLPHFPFQAITPNDLEAQEHAWTFPLHPELAAERTDIPLLGTVAIAINGCPIYGPNEAAIPDPFGDPIYNGITDWNQGHTGGSGDYHFHALITQTFYPEHPEGEPSPILGYSLDGFPIYGPHGCVDIACEQVVKFESSWEVTGDPTTYAWDNHACTADSCEEASGTKLDRCNGRVGPDGGYRYHATEGFPYVLGCYSGAGVAGGGGGGQGGNPTGPAPCSQESDCAGECPEGSQGCTCHTTPMNNQICVPTCTTAEDCPETANGGAMNCTQLGVCVPAGGPPGGGP